MNSDWITQHIDIRTIIVINTVISHRFKKKTWFFSTLPFGNTGMIKKTQKWLFGNTGMESIFPF